MARVGGPKNGVFFGGLAGVGESVSGEFYSDYDQDDYCNYGDELFLGCGVVWFA